MKTKKETAHFTIKASFFNNLVRDIYWFENRERAIKMLRCCEGITFKQESLFFTGNAIFEDTEDGTINLNTDYNDKKFKKKITDFLFKANTKLMIHKRNRSGWILRNGRFIGVENYGHIDSAYIINEKLKELKEFEYLGKNYERNLELWGAIKISSNNILIGDSGFEITGQQLKTFKDFFKDYEDEKKKIELNNLVDGLCPLTYCNEELNSYREFEDETPFLDVLKEDLLD